MFFRNLVDTVPALISYVDRDYIYRFTNLAYQKWFGGDGSPIMGRYVWQVIGPDAWQHIEPFLKRAMEGESVRFQSMVPYHNTPRWVDVCYTPVRANGSVLGVCVLVTEIGVQKEAERKLRKEHDFSRTLLSATSALVVVLDTSRNITQVNHAFEATTGWTSDELIGRNYFDTFLAAEDHQVLSEVFVDLVTHRRPSQHVNLIRTKSGEERLIEWSNSVLLKEPGVVDYVLAIGLDITERRRLEKELLVISERERQRVGQELHDSLGQRLTGLELFLHSIKEDLQKQAADTQAQCAVFTRELQQTVKLSRLLSHGLSPITEATGGLAGALRQLASSTFELSRIPCAYHGPEELTPQNPEVSLHLYRITQEAINNALRHSGARKITISLAESSNSVRLSITDDGCGFDPARKHDGLGLRLLRYRAEVIGAHLRVQSAPGKGTTITCTLRSKT